MIKKHEKQRKQPENLFKREAVMQDVFFEESGLSAAVEGVKFEKERRREDKLIDSAPEN
jgi:hypothetical protein